MRRIGVVGSGTMGTGIAHSALVAGLRVVLVEADAAALAAGEARVRASLERAAGRGHLERDVPDLLASLAPASDWSALAGAELVVEAVPESVDLKREVLGRVESSATGAWIATNTSSLSIDTLAEGLTDPARLVGMHFFNPVPASDLVEVVRGSRTADPALDAAHALAALLGKVSIEVADSPGFATSRLGVLLGLEAIRMVEDQVASAADIDQAMVLGYKHPVGPLRLTDLVGLDVRLGIADYLVTLLGPRFAAPQLLRDMVAAGTLGRKSGQGFYTW